MIEPTQTSDRRVMRIAGIVIGAVLVATVSAAGAVLLARRSGVSFTAPSSGSAVVKPLAVSLRRNIEVRAGPAPDQAIVTRLTAAQSVNVIGRSVDSSWLVISPSSAPDIVGWVPADAVEGVRPYPIGDADMVATVAAFDAICRSVKSGRTEFVAVAEQGSPALRSG